VEGWLGSPRALDVKHENLKKKNKNERKVVTAVRRLLKEQLSEQLALCL